MPVSKPDTFQTYSMNPIKPSEIPVLVRNLSAGCELAFKRLFDFFSPKILNTAKKMGLAQEDAEEIQQEVFLIVWKNRDQLKSELSFNAYLLAILKSIIIKKAKAKARKVAFEKYAINFSWEISHETEESLELRELEQVSFSMIERLPKVQREVFKLKSFENMRASDISQKLGISKRTVEAHIYAATKRIREKLQKGQLITVKNIGTLVFFSYLF